MRTHFDQDDQPRDYLLFLLDHEAACVAEKCPLCDHVQDVYDLVQSRFLGKSHQQFGQSATTRIQ